MVDLYFTIEPQWKIKSIFNNNKRFFILDIQEVLDSLDLDLSKESSVFCVNDYIITKITEKSHTKGITGIIYINKNLNKEIFLNMKETFKNNPDINKFILLDNARLPRLKYMHTLFSEVVFFESFKKNKML